MGSRLTWPQIRSSSEFRGRWVALDDCRYDPRTAQPTEGTVVDADEDLVALCARMQASDSRYCSILYCGEGDDQARTWARGPTTTTESSRPPPSVPPRAYH